MITTGLVNLLCIRYISKLKRMLETGYELENEFEKV